MGTMTTRKSVHPAVLRQAAMEMAATAHKDTAGSKAEKIAKKITSKLPKAGK